MNDENNNLDISFIANLNTNSQTLKIVDNFHIDPTPSYSKELNFSNNKFIQESFEPAFKKIFDLGAKNMSAEDEEKVNESEIKYLYEFFGKENEEKDKDENSYLKKKRKGSTEEVKKFKNENFVLKILTNFINEYLYTKLYKELVKINIYLQKKCDRKKFIKANENIFQFY